MKYVYPAVFTPLEDGGYDVNFPDLPGCRTCGADLTDAILMAKDAAAMWLWDAESKNEMIPTFPKAPIVQAPQFVNSIEVDTDEYRKKTQHVVYS